MRRGMAAGAALTIAMLAAMPMQAAVGAKPFREQIRGFVGDYEVMPAGELCSFAVGVQVQGQGITWGFSEDHWVSNNQGVWTFTNLDTDTPYVHRSTYHMTDTFSADGNTVFEVMDGKYFLGFLPGDQGPYGEVGPDGGPSYFVSGTFSLTYDIAADRVTSFDWTGRMVDVCEVLSA